MPGGRIAVVSMPFASVRRPSLQVGLLVALARRSGWEAHGMHFNVEFAALLGRERYEALCQHRGTMLAEWIFAAEAFGNWSGPDYDAFLVDAEFDVTRPALDMMPAEARAWLGRVRRTLAPAFLDAVLDSTAWADYDVVAFTSTFQQNNASFALAGRLKARFPGVTTLFGGANFDGEMGVEFVRSIDAIDLAAIGEADRSFPALLDALADGRDPAALPGIAVRDGTGGVRLTAEISPFADLDSLPVPLYEDYFERMERHCLIDGPQRAHVDLPYESSRGCWWGQKKHCIFCGLNSGTMAFRAKSPGRVVEEVTELSRRYRSLSLEAVDNILDQSYLTTLLPALGTSGLDLNLFYEVKANLSPEQLGLLRRAGVRRVQPGIESLSTRLLATMRKGTTALRNINFLRWCRHHGIAVSWNMLWGFPGESVEDYEEQLDRVRMISHLQPPDGEGRLWLERFSPLFSERETFGVHDVAPLGSYEFVYPPSVDLEKVAYFFDYRMRDALPERTFDPLRGALAEWRSYWDAVERPQLVCRTGPGFIEIVETRPGFAEGAFVLDGTLAAVYRELLERPIARRVVAERAGATAAEVDAALAAFAERALVACEADRAVALAVP